MQSICIRTGNVAPNIYVDGILDAIESGELSLENAADLVVERYEESKSPEIDIQQIASKETILSKVEMNLVNRDRNQERLEMVPHIPMLDLAIVFYVVLNEDENGRMAYMIDNQKMQYAGVEFDDLIKAAGENTKRKSFRLETLSGLMEAMTGQNFNEMDDCDAQPYVITTMTGLNGSIAMLNKELLKDTAEKLGCDYYIIPSSIHECILIPVSTPMNVKEISHMIHEVNTTCVEEQEILSDSLYVYHKETGEIDFAA